MKERTAKKIQAKTHFLIHRLVSESSKRIINKLQTQKMVTKLFWYLFRIKEVEG